MKHIWLSIMVSVLLITVVMAQPQQEMNPEAVSPGAAPNSGDGIPDGSGMDGQVKAGISGKATMDMQASAQNDNSGNAEAPGPAPNSGDGIPDGSGMDNRMQTGNSTSNATGPAPNSGDGIPDGSGMDTVGKKMISPGDYTTEDGQMVAVKEQFGNTYQLQSGNVSANTTMEMMQVQTQTATKLQVKLSNGKDAEVKIMPDVASEKAMDALQVRSCSEENNCEIELKEVGQGDQIKAAYEVQVQKEAKVFGLFQTKMQVQTQINAETGEVIRTQTPWWSFLAA